MTLIRSRQRVADHGEVFTPPWLVDAMLDLVKGESERIDSRFLEPACGSGNFLVRVLERKLAAVDRRYRRSPFERRHYALLGLSCIYGIELLADNVAECREHLVRTLADHLGVDRGDDICRAASFVLLCNIIHGNALTTRTPDNDPITFTEWGYLGAGLYQRRDFRLDALTTAAGFSEEGTLFAHAGKRDIFKPVRSYPRMSIRDLAACHEAEQGEAT